jgi:hypothetical protein
MPGLPGTLPAPDLPPGPRHALVVATTTYTDPELRQLRAPAQDAADLNQVLADPEIGGFTVTSVINKPAQVIRLAVEDFLADRGTQDLVLVYLSCHGLLNAYRRLYFAAKDTRKDRLGATGIEAAWVMDLMEHCRARRQILILDSCFSGAFGNTKGEADLGLRDQFAGQGRGRVVLTASAAAEYSYEGEPTETVVTAGSVFTSALVAGLRTGAADADHDGRITVDEAYAYTFDQVQAAGAAQTPQRWLFGAEGRMVLARSPAGRILARPELPESLRAALDSPLPGIRIAAAGELGAWLNSGDPGQGAAALERLREIADRDIPRVADAARALLSGHSTAEAAAPGPAAPGPAVQGSAASQKPPAAGQKQPAASQKPAAVSQVAQRPPQIVPPEPARGPHLPSRLLAAFTGHSGNITAMAFSPDGKRLATSASGRSARTLLWDPLTGQPLRGLEVQGTAGPFAGMASLIGGRWIVFSPDGSQLAAPGETSREVFLWDSATGQPQHSIPLQAYGVAAGFSPDGSQLAIACHDGTVRWCDPATGHQRELVGLVKPGSKTLDALRRAISGSEEYRSMMFSPGLGALATTSGATVHLWDPVSGERQGAFKVRPGPVGSVSLMLLGFSPDARVLAVADQSRGAIELREAATGLLRSSVSGQRYAGAPFSPDGMVVATGTGDKAVLWEVSNGRQLRVLEPPPGTGVNVTRVAFSPHGGMLAVATYAAVPISGGLGRPGSGSATVRVWA